MKCGNWIGVVDHTFLVTTLVFSLSALFGSASISKLTFGIMVSIGLLIYVLRLLTCCYKCISNSKGNDLLSNCFSIFIRLWCSCATGLMSSVDISGIQNEKIKTAITWMLLISIGIKAISSLMQRCLGLIKHTARPVALAEALELVGFSVTGLVVLPGDLAFFYKYGLFLILVSFAPVVALRLLPVMYNPYAIFFFILITVGSQAGLFIYFNSSFDVHDAALCCSAYRILIDPVLDLLFRKPSILLSKEGPSEVVIKP